MKLDTSSYYPESLLEEEVDEKEEMTVDPQNDRTEEKDNKEEKKNEPEVSSLPSASERFADGSATFLSWALVPLLMPVYGVLLAFNLSILDFTPYSVKLVFTLVHPGIHGGSAGIACPAVKTHGTCNGCRA